MRNAHAWREFGDSFRVPVDQLVVKFARVLGPFTLMISDPGDSTPRGYVLRRGPDWKQIDAVDAPKNIPPRKMPSRMPSNPPPSGAPAALLSRCSRHSRLGTAPELIRGTRPTTARGKDASRRRVAPPRERETRARAFRGAPHLVFHCSLPPFTRSGPGRRARVSKVSHHPRFSARGEHAPARRLPTPGRPKNKPRGRRAPSTRSPGGSGVRVGDSSDAEEGEER